MMVKLSLVLSLISLTAVYCHHTSDSENQRRDENLISSSEHSRENHHEYSAFEREARRKFEERRGTLSEAYKRIPAIRRVVPGEHDHEISNKKVSNTRLNDDEKRLHEDDDPHSYRSSYPDDESDHVDYQPEEYPTLPIRQSAAPPVVFFGPQTSPGSRGIRLPVYRRPSYSRVYDVATPPLSVSYRTLNPVAYPVPRVRNVVLGYPSGPVRYAYSSPNAAYDSGVVPVEYRGFIAEEYDEFLKKK